MKTKVTLWIDCELINFAKTNQINMSFEFSKRLEYLKMGNKQSIHALNYEIMKSELNKLEEETEIKLREREEKRTLIKDYELKIKTEKESKLKEEAERLEGLKHCQCCQREIKKFIESKGVSYHLCINCLHDHKIDHNKYVVEGGF